MKTIGSILSLVALAACGAGEKTAPPAGPPVVVEATQAMTLRLHGTGGTVPVQVRVASIELSADGVPLAGRLDGREIDLADAQNAAPVMTFDLAKETRKVAIKLQFEPLGRVDEAAGTRTLDLSGPPLTCVADAALLRANGKVVLDVDVPGSVVSDEGGLYLLPAFVLRY